MQTEYVKRISGIYVNVNQLLSEYDSIAKDMSDVTDRNAVPVQKKFHLVERHDTNPIFHSMPYTMSVVERFKNIIDFNSVTYRMVMPNTCYNWHRDWGRICAHVPLITNEGCLFVYEDRCFKMPADGSAYLVNNEKMHTFVNSGKEPRLHLTIENLGDPSKKHLFNSRPTN